jgi:nicotinamide phosphoribosyltransferase
VQCLWDVFGGTVNYKGFKTLDSHVGLIYGDSITLERCENILSILHTHGFASDNIVFGVGSYTYQYVTRDTLGFAMKATYRETDGEGVEIFKDPKTDNGTKKSAKGLIQVLQNGDGDYLMRDQVSWSDEDDSELVTVFENGSILSKDTFEELRNRLYGHNPV